MSHTIDEFLNRGAVVFPPPGVLAIGWFMIGFTKKGDVARLVGCDRKTLDTSPQYEDFRRVYAEWKSNKSRPQQASHPIAKGNN